MKKNHNIFRKKDLEPVEPTEKSESIFSSQAKAELEKIATVLLENPKHLVVIVNDPIKRIYIGNGVFKPHNDSEVLNEPIYIINHNTVDLSKKIGAMTAKIFNDYPGGYVAVELGRLEKDGSPCVTAYPLRKAE